MLEKLSEIDQRFEKLTELLIRPETVADQQQFRTLSREHSELQESSQPIGSIKKSLNLWKKIISLLMMPLRTPNCGTWLEKKFRNLKSSPRN